MLAAPPEEKLALIRAHPELLGKLDAAELTESSRSEQSGAGLDRCTPEELARMQALNARYLEKFGFPFIVAVKGHNPASVIATMERRMVSSPDAERAVSLDQIGRIGGFRLADLVEEPIGIEVMAMSDALARFSERQGGLTCSYLSDAHGAAPPPRFANGCSLRDSRSRSTRSATSSGAFPRRCPAQEHSLPAPTTTL